MSLLIFSADASRHDVITTQVSSVTPGDDKQPIVVSTTGGRSAECTTDTQQLCISLKQNDSVMMQVDCNMYGLCDYTIVNVLVPALR
jgi:hypothetical protein